jgi:hypothetical protein
MHALNPIDHRRSPARPVYLKEARRPHNRCPQCDHAAPGPLSSAHSSGGVVLHVWKCEACDCDWHTSFQPLLV